MPARSHAHTSEVAGGNEFAGSNTAGAGLSNTVTFSGTPNFTSYITYFVVTAQAVAAVVGGTITVTGVTGGPLTYEFVETVSAGGYMPHAFRPPLPATGTGVDIVVTLSAIGGGSATAIVVTGWQAADVNT